MTTSAPGTRDLLLRAAERLFAERGLLGVSQREILREAGARNATALQYHFGDRDGLVRAVLDARHEAIDRRRHELLDRYVAEGHDNVRDLAAALVLPLAAELNSEGGRAYLQVLAELIGRPHSTLDVQILTDRDDAIMRWRELLDPLLDPGAVALHRRFAAIRFCIIELGRRAHAGGAPEVADDDLFVSHLIDLVAAVLAAPTSAATAKRVAAPRPDGNAVA